MGNAKIWIWLTKSRLVRLPLTLEFEQSGEVVEFEKMMISGKLVRDFVGYRPVFTAKWDYFPQDVLKTVLSCCRSGNYYELSITSDGGSRYNGNFKIEQMGGMAFFKYSKPAIYGGPIWHGLTLKFTAQEVV